MDKQTELRKTVAEILQTDSDEIGPDTDLRIRRLQGSIGRGMLDAALRRRLGISCPGVYTARTFGELEAAVFGNTMPADGPNDVAGDTPKASAAAIKKMKSSEFACGIDLEMIDNLPEAEDYWETDFYRTFFTDSEIAYCASQENPRLHFAARWCAKEALKKCGPEYIELEPSQIEVVVNEFGKPSLRIVAGGQRHRVPAAVSLTETLLVAGAVVILAGNERSKSVLESGNTD